MPLQAVFYDHRNPQSPTIVETNLKQITWRAKMTVSTSVSDTSTTTKSSRFSASKTETTTRTIAAAKSPARNAFARSPYREKTVMLRVPESLAKEFRLRLEQHKQAVAAGDHDNWD
jgi:DNA-dependent RNA polymerase auxiliary subunit epsilon